MSWSSSVETDISKLINSWVLQTTVKFGAYQNLLRQDTKSKDKHVDSLIQTADLGTLLDGSPRTDPSQEEVPDVCDSRHAPC